MNSWKAALRFALAAVALLLLFKFVRVDEIGSTLASASGAGLLLGLLLNLSTRFAAGARTYALSRAARLPVTYARTMQALYVSNFWSLALPGVSAGSVATVCRYRGHGAGAVESVAVLCASRLVELMAFCLLALIGLGTTSATGADGSHSWTALLLVGVIIAVTTTLLLLRYLPSPTPGTGARPSIGLVYRARSAITEAITLLRNLSRWSLLQAAGWALLQGILDALTVLAFAQALNIPIGLSQALWINALSYLAILLPISAAGLGVREGAVLAALVPLGVTPADAVSLAVLMLAATLLNALIGALLQVGVPAAGARSAAP